MTVKKLYGATGQCGWLLFLVSISILFFALSCSSENKQEAASGGEAAKETDLLSSLKLNEKSENILFTYMNEKSAFVTVEKDKEVPDPFRNDVIIINLKLAPDQRQSATKVAVADLNSKDLEGNYKITLENRAGFERSLKLKRQWKLTPIGKTMPAVDPNKFDQQALAQGNSDAIILYSTSWCGYCRKVREFFKANNVPFIEKDIEKDQQAAVELQTRCAMQKVQCNGVPIVDWKGHIIPGYDEPTFRRLLAQTIAGKKQPGPKRPGVNKAPAGNP